MNECFVTGRYKATVTAARSTENTPGRCLAATDGPVLLGTGFESCLFGTWARVLETFLARPISSVRLYTARGNTQETVLLAKSSRISLRPAIIPLRQPPPVEAQQSAAPEKTARLACHRRHRAAKGGRRQRPGGRRKCVAGPDNGSAGGQQTVTRGSHDPSEKPCRQEMSTIVAALISSKAVCFR
jgi:hypothetical protein